MPDTDTPVEEHRDAARRGAVGIGPDTLPDHMPGMDSNRRRLLGAAVAVLAVASACSGSTGTSEAPTVASASSLAATSSTSTTSTSPASLVTTSSSLPLLASGAVAVLGRFLAFAADGALDAAIGLVCPFADSATRTRVRDQLATAAQLWSSPPTLEPTSVRPSSDGSFEITYGLSGPGVSTEPGSLRARVATVDGSLRLCGVEYASRAAVADALTPLKPVPTKWQNIDGFTAALRNSDLAALGWAIADESTNAGPRDAQRHVVRRHTFELVDTTTASKLTARVGIQEFDSDESASTDADALATTIAQTCYVAFDVPGISAWGARGGEHLFSYLEPIGIGPVFDTLVLRPATAAPTSVGITVSGLTSTATNDRARKLALALLSAPS